MPLALGSCKVGISSYCRFWHSRGVSFWRRRCPGFGFRQVDSSRFGDCTRSSLHKNAIPGHLLQERRVYREKGAPDSGLVWLFLEVSGPLLGSASAHRRSASWRLTCSRQLQSWDSIVLPVLAFAGSELLAPWMSGFWISAGSIVRFLFTVLVTSIVLG